MTFDVEVDGWSAAVTVHPAGAGTGRVRVSVQPRAATGEGSEAAGEAAHHDVELSATELGLLVRFLETGRLVDATVVEQDGGECLVQLPHITLTARVDNGRRRRGAAGHRAGAGEQRIQAPMPGRVLRVLVKPGDRVSARQPLVVVEAMKMENELTALRPGVVRELPVEPGTSVEAGRLLAIIDAEG
jgi:biotin carboxyl carrier protein